MGFWFWFYIIVATLYSVDNFIDETQRNKKNGVDKNFVYYFFYVVFGFFLMPVDLISKICIRLCRSVKI
jgi:hypothetical protein